MNGEHLKSPPPSPSADAWAPFEDRPQFEFAQSAFEDSELSARQLNDMLNAVVARNISRGGTADDAIFQSHGHVMETIDNIQEGDLPFKSFSIQYTGPVDENSPSWKRAEYIIHCRDTLSVVESIAANPEFKGFFNYKPYKEYVGRHRRRWSNLMSGQWAWKQSVSMFIISVSFHTLILVLVTEFYAWETGRL